MDKQDNPTEKMLKEFLKDFAMNSDGVAIFSVSKSGTILFGRSEDFDENKERILREFILELA